MKSTELRNLISEEVKKVMNEAANPFTDKLDAIEAKINSLLDQRAKVIDQAVKSVDLEIQGSKAIYTRKSDGRQFLTTKDASGRGERKIKDMKTGEVWGAVSSMTLDKIKYPIAMDNPNAALPRS